MSLPWHCRKLKQHQECPQKHPVKHDLKDSSHYQLGQENCLHLQIPVLVAKEELI